MGAGSSPELRVEELAGRADVSVDTIRFYQKRRLLPPPQRRGRIAWYGPEHVERLARIKDLQRRGFSLAVIRRIVTGELDRADEPLAAAVVGAAEDGGGAETGAEEFLRLDELAARSGVPQALIESIVREGLLVPRRHEGDAGSRPPTSTSSPPDCVSSRRACRCRSCSRWHAGITKPRVRRPRARSRCSTPTCASPSAPRTCPTTSGPTGSSRRSVCSCRR